MVRKPTFRHGDTVEKNGVVGVVKKVLTTKELLHIEDVRGDLFIIYDDTDVHLVKRYEKPPSQRDINRKKREQLEAMKKVRQDADDARARDKLKRSLDLLAPKVEAIVDGRKSAQEG